MGLGLLKRSGLCLLLLGLVLAFAAGYLAGGLHLSPTRLPDQDLLYQVSTYTSLAGGGYDPVELVGTLLKNGDLGLGTFAGLDGEMVVVDGTCYQVKSDGTVHIADPSLGVPFAAVTFFSPDLAIPGVEASNLTELTTFLDRHLPSRDMFYAIRIDGAFPYVKARSVPAQAKPYPPLADAISHEAIFEFRNVTGTVVGFYSPPAAAGMNVAGYHFHFLTSDRTRGGHVLDMATAGDTVELDSTPRFTAVLVPEGLASTGPEH
ncbi:MAG TPA: acetolactate decarboxylase [Methanomicrobiales archaeon]|nr:acetolactate decarboxylase [Methanomicrobiales archaeon]